MASPPRGILRRSSGGERTPPSLEAEPRAAELAAELQDGNEEEQTRNQDQELTADEPEELETEGPSGQDQSGMGLPARSGPNSPPLLETTPRRGFNYPSVMGTQSIAGISPMSSRDE